MEPTKENGGMLSGEEVTAKLTTYLESVRWEAWKECAKTLGYTNEVEARKLFNAWREDIPKDAA